MGDHVSDNGDQPEEVKPVQPLLPRGMMALVNRILQLDSGVHLLHIVKNRRGKDGLVGWQVTVGKGLEQPKRKKEG